MKDIFDKSVSDSVIERIEKLTPETQPAWGKMSVDQMLAHLNVSYDMVYTDKYPKAGFLKTLLLKTFVKKGVVGEKPYPKNSPTAPQFIIKGSRDYEQEKSKLIDYIRRVQKDGRSYYEGLESLSFGPLTSDEWNILYAKHLDHHLTQFGV